MSGSGFVKVDPLDMHSSQPKNCVYVRASKMWVVGKELGLVWMGTDDDSW